MGLGNKLLTSLFSASMVCTSPQCSADSKSNWIDANTNKIEISEVEIPASKIPTIWEMQRNTKKLVFVCLKTDGEDSFTCKKVLESITDPQNTTLEFPLSPLFKKYWDRVHPLVVRWVNKDFRALLWKGWIEDLSGKIPQKLSPRTEEITSDTKYEIWDTLRFSLINPSLQWAFPQKLSEQLKEDWFQTFSDPEASEIEKKLLDNQKDLNIKKKTDFIYDIVVKRLPSWKSALALYRDWELFMATYASVWLNNKKTVMWQHEIIEEDAYKRSITHHDAPMPFGLKFYGWYWTHQWDVTWKPASYGCVRQPGAYALVSYSLIYPLVKNKKRVDVFIDKNLYKSKK